MGRLFGRGKSVPRGLYIYGDVGRGKTMLMDMFFARTQVQNKRRVHFHGFMDELHLALARFSGNGSQGSGQEDLIRRAVDQLTASLTLLCFDEFHVDDITNAMLLGRVFEQILDAGIVVVATSNEAPDDLYQNGLNRSLFVPFVRMLSRSLEVVHLQSACDYRLDQMIRMPVFHFGTEAELKPEMDRHWQMLTGGKKAGSTFVQVAGRRIPVPEAVEGNARFHYADLCEQPLGARDYLAISHNFHTLLIQGIPRFDTARRDGKKRFMELIDTLYDRGVQLVAGFLVPLDRLSGDSKNAFAFQRTLSRLSEMESEDYLTRAGRLAVVTD